jgi:hypothetical protein
METIYEEADEEAGANANEVAVACKAANEVMKEALAMQAAQAEEHTLVPIMYNGCYGGWSPSHKALELYKERRKKSDKTFGSDELWSYHLTRDDPLLVQLFYELGKAFDTDDYSKTRIALIPKQYIHSYYLTNDDGLERVHLGAVPLRPPFKGNF